MALNNWGNWTVRAMNSWVMMTVKVRNNLVSMISKVKNNFGMKTLTWNQNLMRIASSKDLNKFCSGKVKNIVSCR
jgi:hypothetical protein